MAGDARHDPRQSVVWRGTVKFGAWSQVAQVANVSRRGLFLKTSTPPPVGSEVEVVLECPDGQRLVVRGVVRHRWLADDTGAIVSSGAGIEIHAACSLELERLAALALAGSTPPAPVPDSTPSATSYSIVNRRKKKPE